MSLLDMIKGFKPEKPKSKSGSVSISIEHGKDEEDDGRSEAESDAGDALKAALDSGDGKAIYEAFMTLSMLCEDHEDEPSEPDDMES